MSESEKPANPLDALARDYPDISDPSWFPRVLNVLARDFPDVSTTVWETAVTENAAEQVAKRRQGFYS